MKSLDVLASGSSGAITRSALQARHSGGIESDPLLTTSASESNLRPRDTIDIASSNMDSTLSVL